MPISLRLLGWTLLLGLVQIFLAAGVKRRQDGLAWAAGSRDAAPPEYTGLAGRLHRAQLNLFETLPLFAASVLAVHLAGRDGPLATVGAQLFFWSRLVYVPLYAWGVKWLRTAAFGVAVAGLCLELVVLLR